MIDPQAPKYARIANALRTRVQSGELRAGDRLPAETALADEFATSVLTVRQAMSVLRAEGVIESRQGIGTFVREDKRMQRRSRNRYGEARGRDGLLSNAFRHQIIGAGREPVPEHIADAMQLHVGDPVIVRRRHLIDEQGGLVEIGASYLPADFVAETYLAVPTVVPKALFRCVEEITGRTYTHARDQWTARRATVDEAEAFRMPLGSYVLHVVHTATDEGGQPLEVSESIWPADRVIFVDEYGIPAATAENDARSEV